MKKLLCTFAVLGLLVTNSALAIENEIFPVIVDDSGFDKIPSFNPNHYEVEFGCDSNSGSECWEQTPFYGEDFEGDVSVHLSFEIDLKVKPETGVNLTTEDLLGIFGLPGFPEPDYNDTFDPQY